MRPSPRASGQARASPDYDGGIPHAVGRLSPSGRRIPDTEPSTRLAQPRVAGRDKGAFQAGRVMRGQPGFDQTPPSRRVRQQQAVSDYATLIRPTELSA